LKFISDLFIFESMPDHIGNTRLSFVKSVTNEAMKFADVRRDDLRSGHPALLSYSL
jgi:hypothetical protein